MLSCKPVLEPQIRSAALTGPPSWPATIIRTLATLF